MTKNQRTKLVSRVAMFIVAFAAKQPKPFSSVVLDSLFTGRSSNNYGYLAAVLIAEKVLAVLPGKPVLLTLGTWDTIHQKIQALKEQDVSLTDHIAIANIQKAERRAELVAKMRTAKKVPAGQAPDAEKCPRCRKWGPLTLDAVASRK